MLEGKSSFRALHENFGRIEFNISKHVLDIVYTQAICWLALFYAPLISVVTVIKCIAIYLLRIFYVIYVSSMSVNRSLMMFTINSYFLLLLPLFSIIQLKSVPSL
jgi:hypothetical protein